MKQSLISVMNSQVDTEIKSAALSSTYTQEQALKYTVGRAVDDIMSSIENHVAGDDYDIDSYRLEKAVRSTVDDIAGELHDKVIILERQNEKLEDHVKMAHEFAEWALSHTGKEIAVLDENDITAFQWMSETLGDDYDYFDFNKKSFIIFHTEDARTAFKLKFNQ